LLGEKYQVRPTILRVLTPLKQPASLKPVYESTDSGTVNLSLFR
jgi:hypothetical protein